MRVAQGIHPDVGLVQDGRRQAAFLVQQGEQQVFGIDLLVAMLDGEGLGRADGVLQFFGESVEVHRGSILIDVAKLSRLLSTNISLPPA